MFAGKLVARTSAAEHGFGGVGKIRGRPVIILATAFAVTKEKGPICRTKESGQFPLQHNSTRILDRCHVRGLRIRVSFIDLHGLSPDFSWFGSRHH